MTQGELKEALRYFPNTGQFFWRVTRKGGGALAGKQAGRVSGGYRRVTVNGRSFLEHRLAWLYVTGQWPPQEVDHINLNGLDNRWVNLRLATRSQNLANKRGMPASKLGVKGVCIPASMQKAAKPYVAQIQHQGKVIRLGSFASAQEAKTAYQHATQALNGEFARTG